MNFQRLLAIVFILIVAYIIVDHLSTKKETKHINEYGYPLLLSDLDDGKEFSVNKNQKVLIRIDQLSLGSILKIGNLEIIDNYINNIVYMDKPDFFLRVSDSSTLGSSTLKLYTNEKVVWSVLLKLNVE
jgi:hypothetical protein